MYEMDLGIIMMSVYRMFTWRMKMKLKKVICVEFLNTVVVRINNYCLPFGTVGYSEFYLFSCKIKFCFELWKSIELEFEIWIVSIAALI